MSVLRFMRRKISGSSLLFKMFLLILLCFGLLQLTLPAPQRPLLNPQQQNDLTDRVLSRKVTVENRRPGKFYQNVIVHFDLKGAPPKVPYFLDLLTLVANSGATGILLEWEDTFPFTGPLEVARSTDAYSMEEVRTILNHAKKLKLDITPLVQTFGHLEWILKLEPFRKYRDNDQYTQVLCLGDSEAVALVKDALDQVIKVHSEYGIPYFHIGCDEAFQFGNCDASRSWMDVNKAGKEELALTHMREIALHVSLKNEGTVVLAWNDMLKSFNAQTVKKLRLGGLIEPVVWDYSEGIVTQNEMTWQALAHNFQTVWASSAYKGANFPSAQFIDIRHYEQNNRDWIKHKQQHERKFTQFRGIIITGWQRYDHMAGLCEILPMGTPSMVLQIETALSADNPDQSSIRRRVQEKLNCSDFKVQELEVVSHRCGFPGFQAYLDFQMGAQNSMKFVEEELQKNHQILGWLSPYTRRHGYAQNWYLEQIRPTVANLKDQLDRSVQALRRSMSPLFLDNTIDEFIFLSIGQKVEKMAAMIRDLDKLMEVRVWPRRHFPIKKALLDEL